MADGTFPGLVSKDRDPNLVTNPIFVELTDGSTAIGVTGTSLNVNVTGISGGMVQYAVDTAAGATDSGNLTLVVRDDALTTLTPVDGDYVQLRVGSTGALWTTFTNTAIGVNNASGASAVNIQDGGNTITVDGAVTVSASALDIRSLTLAADAVKVSGNSSANSLLNPIYVQVVKTSTETNEIHDYLDGTSTGETVSNHDYTVAGATFLLSSVIVSCSGAMKAIIQTGPVGSLVTKAVVFLNARQGDTKQVFFDPPIEVPVASTGTVRIARYSRNGTGNNVDLYSTIVGNDVV
jgi:hypothetical protein